MKKLFILSSSMLLLASCMNEELIDNISGSGAKDGPIGFITDQANLTKASSYQDMQKTGHYNFGVFAYKNTDKENNIMANYLVGYMDQTNNKGYKFGANQTTLGDVAGQVDGQSMWQYEGLGSSEYLYADGEGYFKASQTEYMSNVATQYLRYWDNASASTCFYAYAPYINGGAGVTAAYVDGTAVGASTDTYVMTIPNGTIKDATVEDGEDFSLSEYMYASTKVDKANYGHDVALQFHRLNAKVNIKFWEDVPGYSVRILDLKEGTYAGVQAAASIKDGTSNLYGYKGGKYYSVNGAKIQFADGAKTGIKQYEGTVVTNTRPIVFTAPTADAIGETRFTAVQSPTTYYAIPKGDGAAVLTNNSNDISQTQAAESDLAITGFTFHVTYELTSTTGEKIVVKNATVHVPENYCDWAPNTHYTYIFKITKKSNGSTDDFGDITVDPTDPEVPTELGLYPIVFDNCTVADWDENESEWNITDGTSYNYHDVQLSTYSLVSGDIVVTVTDNDEWAGHTIDYTKITVAHANGTDVSSWYNSGTKTITVPADATAGVYTVTYTCTPGAGVHANHPETWTEKFVVGSVYAVSTHLTEIGTNSTLASAKLNITATQDGNNVTSAASTAGQLEVVYPDNFTDAQKAEVKVVGTDVVVTKNAVPGVYKLVYTVDEGSKVKVAEQQFTVVDYSFALNEQVVYNTVGGTTVTGNKVSDADHVYTVTGGFTVTGASIAVPNDTPEDTYTVTYTVQGDNDAKTVYTQDFVVKNTHAVALDKSTINRLLNATGSMTFGTDKIVITTSNNGVDNTTDKVSALKVVTAAGAALTATTFYDASSAAAANTANQIADGSGNNPGDPGYTPTYNPGFPVAAGDILSAGDYKITFSATKNELQVNKALATGTYKVVYTQNVSGSPVEEVATFIVQ